MRVRIGATLVLTIDLIRLVSPRKLALNSPNHLSNPSRLDFKLINN